ncbi:hypothetical protein AOLI_G00100030 [Acnodon oligacanthus]
MCSWTSRAEESLLSQLSEPQQQDGDAVFIALLPLRTPPAPRHGRQRQREKTQNAVHDGTSAQIPDLVRKERRKGEQRRRLAEWLTALTGYKRVFEEYTRVLTQRYPDIRIQGENYLPQPIYRHIASFLSMFKLAIIGFIIVGKDPFALFGVESPRIWAWGQENKIYACMMVFFLSNMIENQCMSTGAFEISLNDVPVWSKLDALRSRWLGSQSCPLFCIRWEFPVSKVALMKVCAESSASASVDWMSSSILLLLLGLRTYTVG